MNRFGREEDSQEFEERRYSHDEFRRILEEATTWPGGGSHGSEELGNLREVVRLDP